MRGYESIFNMFGGKPLAQIVAAVVIGAIFGVTVAVRIPPEEKSPRWLIIAGCAAVGLLAGSALAFTDMRRRRADAAAAAGLPVRKPMNGVLLTVLLFMVVVVLIAAGGLISVIYF